MNNQKISFTKFQGTGNDFIMINNLENPIEMLPNEIVKLCNRRFGVGADGVIFINKHPKLDFEMEYYNKDGTLGSFCGNGSRCAVKFYIGIKPESRGIIEFSAYDGYHEAQVSEGKVYIKLNDVTDITTMDNYFFLNNGSPHVVQYLYEKIDSIDVDKKGKVLRNVVDGATNVNFVNKINERLIYVRTYERGVEEETLSCGTGSVASALLSVDSNGIHDIEVKTKGGNLFVKFKKNRNSYSEIFLSGEAEEVFTGYIPNKSKIQYQNK